jgi:hypothetical protein
VDPEAAHAEEELANSQERDAAAAKEAEA